MTAGVSVGMLTGVLVDVLAGIIAGVSVGTLAGVLVDVLVDVGVGEICTTTTCVAFNSKLLFSFHSVTSFNASNLI